MLEFIVQWFDEPTQSWKKWGAIESDTLIATRKAYDLWGKKRHQIHVKVIRQETIYDLQKD